MDGIDGYDSQLLKEVQDLCKFLNLKTRIRRLSWFDRVTGSKVNSDDCRYGLDLAVFPDRMKGRLEPKEWRPLVASSLIYRKILVRRLGDRVVVMALAAFAFLTVGAAVVLAIFGSSSELPFLISALPLAGLFVVNRFTHGSKKLRLPGDLEAANVVGSEELLSVLRKIDSLGIKDVKDTERRGLSRHFSGKPSVAERIANLAAADLKR